MTYPCPVCDADVDQTFIEISQVPIYCNVLWSNKSEAQHAPRGDIHLAYCPDCGHVFNVAFQPELMHYTQTYENSLHFSPRFQEYIEALADRLIKTYHLEQKTIIELGCGQGDFLKILCQNGRNTGFGFDPSYVPPGDKDDEGPHLTFIQDYYSEKYRSYQADFICCRHVLEHIPKPREFLKALRRSISEQGSNIFFEVPNVMYTLKDMGIWDLIYEHCSYYSPISLRYIFQAESFTVANVQDEYNSQFLGLEGSAATLTDSSIPDSQALAELNEHVKAFSKQYHQKREDWFRRLAEMRNQKEKVVVWGAGPRGSHSSM